jgi:hypothetical protein
LPAWVMRGDDGCGTNRIVSARCRVPIEIVSACSFVLELRRWFDEGVKLSMLTMAEAKTFGGVTPDPNTYVAVTVTNRGDAPTTITHLVVYTYPNKVAVYTPRWLSRYFKQLSPKVGFVPKTGAPGQINRGPIGLEQ